MHDRSLLNPIAPWLRFSALVSFFINALLLATPIYMLQLFDRVLVSQSFPTLIMLTLITVAMVLIYGLLDSIRSRILSRAGYLLEQDLAPRVLERMHDFQPLPQTGGGAEPLRDVMTLRSYLSSPHLVSLFDSPWAPIFTLVIFLFSWKLGIVTVMGIAALLLLALMDEKYTYTLHTKANAAGTEAWQFANGSVRNAEVVHALGMKGAMLAIWNDLATRAVGHLKVAADRSAHMTSTARVLRILIQVAMLGVGAYLVIVEHLSPGIMIAGTIIVARAIAPVEGTISGWKFLVDARNAYARLTRLLCTDPTAADRPEVALPAITGNLELEHVHYGFGPGNMLFGNVSIQLKPGEALGLIGPSGSGKSTLARIMLGITAPTQGKVTLDGYDIRHYEREALGRQLGYLPQNVGLFASSIGHNIARMQDPEAHAAEIVRVAEWVGLKPLLARFEDGFQARLTENGLNLSGGQRQLVGLARAVFGSPRLIVLDEPDANLDQQGEAQLIRLLREIRQKRLATLIVISHNPRIIEQMDRLLLLENGKATQLVKDEKAHAKPSLELVSEQPAPPPTV